MPVTLIGKRGKLDPRAYRRLKRLVASLRPDLIHTWLFAANLYGRMAGKACGVKCLVAGERRVDPGRPVHFWIDRRLARSTARSWSSSPRRVRRTSTRPGPAAGRSSEAIANGVSPIPSSPVTRQELLAELGLRHARLIGLVGRLWPQKRVKDAIWAADLLKVIRGGIHLLVIGDGPHRAAEAFRDRSRSATRSISSAPEATFPGSCPISTSSGPRQRVRGPIEHDHGGNGGGRARIVAPAT